MQERLLQYIWQHQYFQTSGLTTVQGQPLEVLDSGIWNQGQGPDFLHARLRIGGTLWAGQVEIHVRAGDWYKHRHEGDLFYQNVILHVVWEQELEAPPGQLPTLQLRDWVPGRLLSLYAQWMEAPKGIACAGTLHVVSELDWLAWKQALAVERLQQKGAAIRKRVLSNQGDWEGVFWQLIFHYMGGNVNSTAFEQVFTQLGWPLIRKYRNRLPALEALLLGTAGFLTKEEGEVDVVDRGSLQKHYHQLVRKHAFSPPQIRMKQLRMRPASFPLIRIRQVARLLHRTPNLFESMGQGLTAKAWQSLLRSGLTENGLDQAGAEEDCCVRSLGSTLIDTLIINVVLPMATVYPYVPLEKRSLSLVLEQLRGLGAERHHITRIWRSFQVEVAQARDSQALLQLYEAYCRPKNCLACRVGHICLSDPTNAPSC